MEVELIKKLIGFFKKFPGISLKHSEKIVFSILNSGELRHTLKEAVSLLDEIERCGICGYFKGRSEKCSNCLKDSRVICVVESFSDMLIIDKTAEFSGSFHITGGVISPLEGVLPEHLFIENLNQRIKDEKTEELILAISSTIEGEATVQYIIDSVRDSGVMISRIARGVPAGSRLEQIDAKTVSLALHDRHQIS